VLDAQMRALGASAVPMTLAEAFDGMRSGLVDGAECLPADFKALRLPQVQSHLTLSGHGYQGVAVIVNKRFWDGIPAELRALVQGALHDATQFGNAAARQANEGALAHLHRDRVTVHTLTADEQQALRRALMPVHQQMERRIGAELIRRAYRATGFDPAVFA
jgi:C4-dicarboxylate-binding protein DctP